MGSQDHSDWVVDITQNFDDDLRMLDMNLTTMMAASRGDYDFTKLDPETLAASWRSIERSSEMLRVALRGFSRRHAWMVDRLVSSRLLSETSRADLCKQPKASQKVLSLHHSDIQDIWQGFIALDQQSYLYLTGNWRDDRVPGPEISRQLEIAINWIKGAINVLRGGYSQIEHARAVLAPVLRLNADILTIIFGQLAEFEAPTRSSLGWIRLSHVCSGWREVLLDMHSLWARDAYVFGPATARRYILSRAQDSLISVTARRLPAMEDGKLRFSGDQVVCLSSVNRDIEQISQMAVNRSLRDIYVEVLHGRVVKVEGMQTLAELMGLLGEFEQPHLRSLSVTVPWMVKDSAELPLIQMAPHPVLRRIELVNIFIPFSLPCLSSLHLFCTHLKSSEDSRMPRSWLDGLLDALDSSPALTDLRIVGWTMPPLPPDPRKITLLSLTTLCSTTSDILPFLELPTLQCGYIADNTYSSTHSALTSVLTRYGYTPRSLQLSQRSASEMDRVILRFERDVKPWRPLIAVPFSEMALLSEPGPYLTIDMPLSKALTNHTISVVFPVFAAVVSRLPGTDGIHTLALDNETREHTFYGPSGNTSFQPMLLPPFPSAQTIELSFRDKDTMYHILTSLAADHNMENLPLLSCIRLIGPLDLVDNMSEVHRPLSMLAGARASLQGVSPIKYMEIVCFPDSTRDSEDDDRVEPPKPTLKRVVLEGVATLRVESMADDGGWEVSQSTSSSA